MQQVQSDLLKQIKAIDTEIQTLKDQIELLNVKKRQLQNKCPHTNAKTYKDYGGGNSWHCPDCELSR